MVSFASVIQTQTTNVFRPMSVSSTTAGTVGRFSVTVARTMSFLCPPHQNQSGCVTPATPSSSSAARLIQRERVPRICRDHLKVFRDYTRKKPTSPQPCVRHIPNLSLLLGNGPRAWTWRPLDQSNYTSKKEEPITSQSFILKVHFCLTSLLCLHTTCCVQYPISPLYRTTVHTW